MTRDKWAKRAFWLAIAALLAWGTYENRQLF
jgi:hypothetical protein